MVDNSNHLQGVLTDGDLRRMVLSGRGLEEPLDQSDLKPFVKASVGENVPDLLKRINRKIRFVPILDGAGRLVDYFRFEHETHFTPVAKPDLEGNELNYVTDAILSTWISSRGHYIDRFEKEFADFCEVDHGIAVSNGTVALQLALRTLGVGKGDEVIIPDLTFAATANAVLNEGATPVLVDIEPDSWTLNPVKVEQAVTNKTKAMIPVHLYGQPCNMKSLREIAEQHNLFIIEDAAEAHGARFDGQRVGGLGDIGCFSFFANKIITTGEGGMCTTNNPDLAQRMRVLRDHGMNPDKRYWHDHVGFNFRMTNIQAAVGCAQLERIDRILNGRMKIEEQYRSIFAGDDTIHFQETLPQRQRVVWLVSALCTNRESIIAHLNSLNIETRPFFYSLSQMPLYSEFAADCRVSHDISKRGVNFPTYEGVAVPELLQP